MVVIGCMERSVSFLRKNNFIRLNFLENFFYKIKLEKFNLVCVFDLG